MRDIFGRKAYKFDYYLGIVCIVVLIVLVLCPKRWFKTKQISAPDTRFEVIYSESPFRVYHDKETGQELVCRTDGPICYVTGRTWQ